jgi:hypothetical protein
MIGDALTLDFYNPLGRAITVRIIGDNGSEVDVFENLTGIKLSGYNAQDTINKLYASIPNSQSGRYKVVVNYGNIAMTRDAGNTYKVRGTEIPTINGFDYIDDNANTVAITGDNTKIVQNYSILLVRFHSATANNGAGGISQYYIECNGKNANGNQAGAYDLGTIDSNRDVDLTLTVVDSRGLSASKTIKVKMLAHSKPTANVTLERLNNYEDETYLTVDGSVSSIDGKNTMTIKYRYKVSGGTYGAFTTIGDRAKQTLSLDKNNVFVFNIVITDAFGSTYDEEFGLDKGVFPLFINTERNSVGINKFPVYDKSLEASGMLSLGESNVIVLDVGESVEIPIWLMLCTGLVNFRITGANLEIARLYYVFRTNQYFALHKALVEESYNNTASVVPVEVRNAEIGYVFKFTNNHTDHITIKYGILELC